MKTTNKIIASSILIIIFGALMGVGFFNPFLGNTYAVILSTVLLFITAVGLVTTQPWARLLAIVGAMLMLFTAFATYLFRGKVVFSRVQFYVLIIVGASTLFVMFDEKVRAYFTDIRQPRNKA